VRCGRGGGYAAELKGRDRPDEELRGATTGRTEPPSPKAAAMAPSAAAMTAPSSCELMARNAAEYSNRRDATSHVLTITPAPSAREAKPGEMRTSNLGLASKNEFEIADALRDAATSKYSTEPYSAARSNAMGGFSSILVMLAAVMRLMAAPRIKNATGIAKIKKRPRGLRRVSLERNLTNSLTERRFCWRGDDGAAMGDAAAIAFGVRGARGGVHLAADGLHLNFGALFLIG
jgi:hypothetical protein